MSYILDALKKSQSEQASDGVALRLQSDQSKRSFAPWLGAGLGVVLVVNIALLAWIFLKDNPSNPTTSQVNAQSDRALNQEKIVSEPTNPIEQLPPNQAEEIAAPSSTIQPKLQTTVPRPVATPAPAPVEKYALEDLPKSDQILYNGFRYSTHIYTDDPSLCAIVVDGQRLQEGDSFKGLKVIAITEAGIIFEESRRGVRRQIEVSVLAQWEK